MTSIGETLRRERLRRNLELERISRELKISPKLLQAIEDEHFEKLPGRVFAKNFVRQYARLLELDDDELVGELQRTLEPPPAAPQSPAAPAVPRMDIPLPKVKGWQAVGDGGGIQWSRSLPALALVVIVMLVCSAVYAWWQKSRHTLALHRERPAPAQSAKVKPPAAPAPVPAAAAAPLASPVAAAAKPEPNAVEPASAAAEPASALPEANPNAPVRVQLTAEEPVWVSARSDGKYLFSATLDPAQSRTIDANSAVVLRIGNAGGVQVSLNGKPLGPLGPKGQVRTVQFTSGGFQIVPPAAPKPASGEEVLDPL